MSFWEDRWAKRQEEEAVRRRTPAQERAEAEAAELARLETELRGITLSTLCGVQRPYEEVGVIQGAICDDGTKALIRLKEAARDHECDAVLGVGICSASSGFVAAGTGSFSRQFFAYGTGVRWVASPED